MKSLSFFTLTCFLALSVALIPKKHKPQIFSSFVLDFGPGMIFQEPSELMSSPDLKEVKGSELDTINEISDDLFQGMSNMQKKFFKGFGDLNKFENHLKKMKENIGNFSSLDGNGNSSFFHSEEFYETFENNGNSTKRIKIGQVHDKPLGQNTTTTQLIHEADDGNGNKLSPEEEAKELEKHKGFFGQLKPRAGN